MSILTQGKISKKESIILFIFLAIILFLPIAVLYFFKNSWGELSWQNHTDIAMLEWTGAFLNMFLFLLLFETYRTTGRNRFNFIACGFLSMGILNFIYAINSPGTEQALWLRTFSILTGSLIFLFSIPERNKKSSDVTGAIIKFVIPTILISVLAAWIPFSMKQLLPRLITPKGTISIFGSILLLIPSACFFITAVIWLHKYITNKKSMDLLIAITLCILAQMTLLMRESETWGVLWWTWHIAWIVNTLIACIYMLIFTVNRSIVWKLVFSLGLTFAMTVILASGIIQSHSTKLAIINYQHQLHERNKKLLISNDINLKCADMIINKMADDASAFSNETHPEEKTFKLWVQTYFDYHQNDWMILSQEYGFYSKEIGMHLPQETASIIPQQQKIIKDCYSKAISNPHSTTWSHFYYLPKKLKWYSYAFRPLGKGDINGMFFINVDVTNIVTSQLIKSEDDALPKTIVFSLKTGTILYASLSNQDFRHNLQNKRIPANKLVKKLIATAFSIKKHGREISATINGEKIFISAQPITPPDWGVMKIVNENTFPVLKIESRYFLIAVGMVTLLCGFVVLLILLHKQLSKPFHSLIVATKKIEHGDFNIKLPSKDESEIGLISRAFNHMAGTLKELYSNLATTIDERTTALEEANKADSAKVTFFQNVSHELRTPLHGILSYARLGKNLTVEENPEKINKYFNNINESGERLMAMLDSILDLAKLESGNIQFNFQPTNIYLIIIKVKNELEASFTEKKIELILDIPEKKLIITMDSEMIARVFRNLLGNALKMSTSGSKIIVKLEKAEKEVIIRVIDEGPGIPKEEFNNIFDKFIQVGEGKRKGGTGLGLPICREIIHAHNGSIVAKNGPEKGACFTFNIPLHTLHG